MTGFQAPLNTLREELRVVIDVRQQVLRDEQLAHDDPDHRRQLLTQTLVEISQLRAAVALLERLESGDLIELEIPAAPYRRRQFVLSPPRRDEGLIRKYPTLQAAKERARCEA